MPKKMILKNSEGESLETDQPVALQSLSLNHQTEDDCVDKGICIPHVTGKTLTMTKTKKIILTSADDESFEVDETVALQFQDLNHLLEDDLAGKGIPIPNVTGKTLAKVIEYCKKHVDAAPAAAENEISANSVEEDLKKWDADFVKIDVSSLFDLIAAANSLDIIGLLDLATTAVADMMKGKSPEKINKEFNTAKELTPEEEEEIRREYPWVFK